MYTINFIDSFINIWTSTCSGTELKHQKEKTMRLTSSVERKIKIHKQVDFNHLSSTFYIYVTNKGSNQKRQKVLFCSF